MLSIRKACLLCIVVFAADAFADTCDSLNSENRTIGYHGYGRIRGHSKPREGPTPNETQWEEMCREANCRDYEWCDQIIGAREGKMGPNGVPLPVGFFQAICGCEPCEVADHSQPKYQFAVCASNTETFYDKCWLRRCRCKADRPDITIKSSGQCPGKVDPNKAIPEDICPGDPKGYDDFTIRSDMVHTKRIKPRRGQRMRSGRDYH